MSQKTALLGQGLGLLLNLYITVAVVFFVPYYNWQYAKENGFEKWLLLGEVVPTAKACVWPYFVFSKSTKIQWTDEEKQNLNHFRAAISALKTLGEMSDASKDQSLPLYRVALSEAQQVPDSVLIKLHPELRDRFRNQFQAALELVIRDFENGRLVEPDVGSLVDSWNEWIGDNSKEIQRKLRE